MSLCALTVAHGFGEAMAEKPSSVGGQSSIETLLLDGSEFSLPLRNGQVFPGSESVELDGRRLQKDVDYLIDYEGGTLQIMRSTRKGQQVRVSYRYGADAPKATSGASMNPLAGLGFQFAGGEQKVLLGMGMAERRGDGSLVSSNLYGLKNNFRFNGGSGLEGVVIAGESRKVQSHSLLDGSTSSQNTDDGKSQAILQTLTLGMLGGKVEANIQDISKKFSGFRAFKDAGFSDEQVNALSRERGLKRAGFALKDLGGKGLGFGANYSAVKDGDKSIQWRGYSLNTGALQGRWSFQKVDRDFSRFGDLANGDREQLKQEAGTHREEVDLKLNSKGLQGGYSGFRLEEDTGSSLYRRGTNLKVGGLELSFGDQRVEQGFNRFRATRLQDAGQLEREGGMRRQNYGLKFEPSKGLSLSFQQNWLMGVAEDAPRFTANDFGLSFAGWTFSQLIRKADAGFGQFGAMADGERWNHVNAIGRMYEPADFGKPGEEVGRFMSMGGVERQGTRLQGTLGKDASLMAQEVKVEGQADGASLQSLQLRSKNLDVTLREQETGKDFAEVNGLMDFEKGRIGNITGLGRRDFGSHLRLGAGREIRFNQSAIDRQIEGDIRRQSWSFDDPTLKFRFNRRSVDESIGDLGWLHDPERDLLNQLRGFQQSDFGLEWTGLRNLGLRWQQNVAKNETTGEDRFFMDRTVDYQVNKDLRVSYNQFENRVENPIELLYRHRTSKWGVWRNFGRFGAVSFEQEKTEFEGAHTDAPDSDRQKIAYEANVTDKTKVRTEHTEIRYSDGESEKAHTHTVESQLSPRTGVTVSETTINRPKDQNDEKRRTYGFWWDFGNGMRFSYNFNRHAQSTANGAEQKQVQLTPGQLGALAVGSAAYSTNVIDRQRYQATGNFQISTVKPIQLGFLQDLTLKYGADTFRDHERYQRENRQMGAGFRIGSTALGWDYVSQVGADGVQAVDRTFRLSTDQTETQPYRAKVFYKLRTLPGDQEWMIRDYAFTARIAKGLELTHQLQTNPEVARGDVILGSIPQAHRANRWRLDWKGSASNQWGMSWDELINEQNKTRSRTGGVHLKLFADKPSPLELYYGLEQNDNPDRRRTMHRYHLRFDQRPGPRQLFSVFLGNVSWQHSRDAGTRVQNWSMRVEYQLRF